MGIKHTTIYSTAQSYKTRWSSNQNNKEPNEDWTIEQLLQWCHQRSQDAISSKTNDLINSLQQLYDTAERDIWNLHHLAVQNTGSGPCSDIDIDGDRCHQQNDNDVYKADDSRNTKMVDNMHQINLNDAGNPLDIENKQDINSNTTSAKSKKNILQKNLYVEVLTGPHEGATFLLKPRPSRSCEIGRSKGKKFLSRGVSLHNDSEVSTCHGKFECKAGKMYYTDTGSTNGTSYMGEAMEDNVPMEITDGMVLVFGVSELRFTLVDN